MKNSKDYGRTWDTITHIETTPEKDIRDREDKFSLPVDTVFKIMTWGTAIVIILFLAFMAYAHLTWGHNPTY